MKRCAICENHVQSKHKIYCSPACKLIGRDKIRKKRYCRVCESPMPIHDWNRTCSPVCLQKRMEDLAKTSRKRISRKCQACGSAFDVIPSSNKKTCSTHCRLKLLREALKASWVIKMAARPFKPKNVRYCRECGAECIQPRIRFCTAACSKKWHHRDSSRKDRERARATSAERIRLHEEMLASLPIRICVICKSEFKPKATNHKFCSSTCFKKNKRKRDGAKRSKKIHFRIKDRLSNRLRELLSKRGMQKRNGIVQYMGCSPEEMVKHIEKKFSNGMNWDNYGVHGWHLDHIIPCQRFDLSREDHCSVCFNWRNLRPLWGKDNWSRREMLNLVEALDLDSELVEMAKGVGVELWS